MDAAPLDTLTLRSRQNEGGHIGDPLGRIDGHAKVTGAAHYAAEYPATGLLYGVAVQSAIAKGTITAIDASLAEAAPGVVRVFTHENAPPMTESEPDSTYTRFTRPVPVLQSPAVTYFGEYVALVVARTFEQACHAADLVRTQYEAEPPDVALRPALGRAEAPEQANGYPTDSTVGDFDKAYRKAPVTLDATYETPTEVCAPMEPHATTALWDGEQLTLYDSTQDANGCRTALAKTFSLKEEQVRVVSKFIGGGFGAKYQPWGHVPLAAMAAMELARPVRVVVGRRQMFTATGHRPPTVQRVRLGAEADGTITAFAHDSFLHTSAPDMFAGQVSVYGRSLYAGANRRTTHRVVPLDVPTASIMRAPGEAPGSFAVECAMDEMAETLGLDPVAFRIQNEPAKDPENGQPFSSRSLVACFTEGAERFGWSRRDARPRSMRDGRTLVGYGVSGVCYPYAKVPSQASVTLTADGCARVRTSTVDIGTGAWTILGQIAADALGLAPNAVEVELGDTALPKGAGAGGSAAAGSVGSAVHDACTALRDQLVDLARKDDASPLHRVSKKHIEIADGQVWRSDRPEASEPVEALLARNADALPLEATGKFGPGLRDMAHLLAPSLVDEAYSSHSFGAQFAEVGVDEDSGEVRVRRLLGVYDAGRILNERTARSQLLGGMVMGIGMALTEEAVLDARFGHFVNHDLAEYHVPVHADIQNIEAVMLDGNDPHVNPIGAKGVGELGITGSAAAIANAVYHATGVRVRDLPLTLDKVLAERPHPTAPPEP